MKMTTRISLQNMKYHRSRNILIGIAIFLTTLLLFLIPTVGRNMIDGQYAVTNEIYPKWHALFRNVDQETTDKLTAHHDVADSGLRSDAGYMATKDADVSMIYVNEKGMELYRLALHRGRLPQAEDEIGSVPGNPGCSGTEGWDWRYHHRTLSG